MFQWPTWLVSLGLCDSVPLAAILSAQFWATVVRSPALLTDETPWSERAEFVIETNVAGEIRGVACVRLERRRGHLGFLVIDPALEGQGLEERLRGVASALCEARGCPSMDIQ